MKREERKLIKSINNWLQQYRIKNYVINEDLTINVKGNVDLTYKNLDSFPTYIQFNFVDGIFDCSENKLISLRGCPRIVTGNFLCFNNKLDSLNNCPEEVYGRFFCHGNLRKFDLPEIMKLCDVSYINN